MGFDLAYSNESIIPDDCAQCTEYPNPADKTYEDMRDVVDNVIEQCEELYDYANIR